MERLDKYFKQLTKAAYERHGHAYGEVLAQWPAIAGDRLSQRTVPERMKWPKQADSMQKYGGVLVVRVDPGFALDLQYEAPRLIERVNGYLGFGAVAAIKIVQGRGVRPGAKPSPQPKLEASQATELDERLAGIGNRGLKDALARLGRGVKSAKPTRPSD
jgi:hypothetical protein